MLRRFLSDMRPTDAAEFLIDKVKHSKSNADLLAGMSG